MESGQIPEIKEAAEELNEAAKRALSVVSRLEEVVEPTQAAEELNEAAKRALSVVSRLEEVVEPTQAAGPEPATIQALPVGKSDKGTLARAEEAFGQSDADPRDYAERSGLFA